MNSCEVDLSDSFSRVGNFLISCANEEDLVADIQTQNLKQFLDTQLDAQLQSLCETDSSFFPRAFTDTDLLDVEEPLKEDKTSRDNSEPLKNYKSSNHNYSEKMAERFGNGNNFKPDVVLSNSNQRSGPDGSPALAPASTQPFITSNLSETGELFAPVRTLTFSDIDQNSQVEDSYMNNSRLVSTPNKDVNRSDHYDYSSMKADMFQTGYTVTDQGNVVEEESDSSDSDNVMTIGCPKRTPEFRQLEGEADTDFQSTGPFHPSAHGLSKEFMDQFVGKTKSPGFDGSGNIFSPLGSNVFEIAERRMQASTPPLHSPAPDSPYAKYAKGSPGSCNNRGNNSNQRFEDPDEIQFAISPPRGQQNVGPLHREVIGYGSHPEINHPTNNMGYVSESQNCSELFQTSDQYKHMSAPRNIPKNLNEYFDQHDTEQVAVLSGSNYSKGTMPNDLDTQCVKVSQDDDNDLDLGSRQGDGSDSDADESSHRLQHRPIIPDEMSGSDRPEIVQRMQVSVKLPQATYDTLSANTSHDDKFSGDHGVVKVCPPDIALSGTMGDADGKENLRNSPEKVMDLLQDQSGSMERKADMNAKLGPGKMSQNTNKMKDTVEGDKKISTLGETQAYRTDNTHRTVSVSEEKLPFLDVNPPQELSTDTRQSKQGTTNASQTSKSVGQLFQGQCREQPQPPVSSRLLQETVSQRNKTTQKYVSTVPGVGKPGPSNQNKEFKKPLDVAQKFSNPQASQGQRKVAQNETTQKFKVSDKVKPKTSSTENLSQKQRTGNPSTLARAGGQNAYQPSQGQINRGQSQGQKSQKDPRSAVQCHKDQIGAGDGQGHDGSLHSIEDGGESNRLVTQVQTTSPVPVEQTEQTQGLNQGGNASLDIRGMEEVRQQLQSMMKMSHSHMSPQERSHYEHSDILAGFGVEFGDTSWNPARKEDGFFDNLANFSAQYFTDSGNISRSDASVHAENQRLRDMLEKERYRRKHCEQYIQQLNVKLLETQQQVAVAVSTDKRKDLMIEQLDKQLGRVMEGWKKRDEEKDEIVEKARAEKAEIELKMNQQQQLIANFERDMSEALEALRQEKDSAQQRTDELNHKVTEVEQERKHVTELLEAEKEKVYLLEQECGSVREGRDTLDKKLDQMQRRLHREQDEWFQREQELLQRIEEVSEKNTKILQAERTKNEEQVKLAEEIMEQYQAASTQVKKLEMELDAALREKESGKVEMGIMEAKFENAQRVLEADMHSAMEKQIAEQIADVQRRHEKQLADLHEKHREQVLELSQHNGEEMEKQRASFRDEMVRKEDEFRKQLQELETRLMEYRKENAELKRSKQKLESTRLEILTKLQYTMQSQWNEAVSLLAATPQRNQTRNENQNTLDESSASAPQSVTAVNFSFHSPPRPSANQSTRSDLQATPPRQPHARPANETSPKVVSANQLSPVQSYPASQDHLFSPGRDSFVSHSTEKDEIAIENAAMSHLKQFQDYMNSITKTPEWISSINSEFDAGNGSVGAQREASAQGTPRITSPPDIAALLAAHLHNIQQQQMLTHPPLPASQSGHSMSQPSSLISNHRQLESSQHSASLPPDLNISHQRKSAAVNQNMAPPQNFRPSNPNESYPNFEQANRSVHSDLNNVTAGLDRSETSALWEGPVGYPRAVPIRPPHQSDDPYMNDDVQSVVSAVSAGTTRGYFQGGQSFSPPTKENMENSSEDLSHQANRLNEDYSQLSEKLERHESHQNELQHYIQMLLRKSPGEAESSQVQQNDSLFSQDNEEFDLNDTAQAAQLQRELDRIQQLRHKQETANKSQIAAEAQRGTSDQQPQDTQNKILSEEQLAEVTRLLNQVKGHSQGQSQASSGAVNELLELLKHAQGSTLNQGSRSVRGQRQTGSHGDRHKPPTTGVKRNVQFNPAKGAEGSKSSANAVRTERSATKPCQTTQASKVERKVAGSAMKGEKTQKPAAWK